MLCFSHVKRSKVSPIWVAAQNNHQHIYAFLLNRGANSTSLLQADLSGADGNAGTASGSGRGGSSLPDGIMSARQDIQQQVVKLTGSIEVLGMEQGERGTVRATITSRPGGLQSTTDHNNNFNNFNNYDGDGAAVMTFVKLLMAQMRITPQKNHVEAPEGKIMQDGGIFVTEMELFRGVTACISIQEVQRINATPYPFRREVLAWAQAIFWTIFPQQISLERNSVPHRKKIKQYIECLCLFLNQSMLKNILSLRFSSRLCLKFRQFPVPHVANRIIELQLLEQFLGFPVAAHISTGVLAAALLKTSQL